MDLSPLSVKETAKELSKNEIDGTLVDKGNYEAILYKEIDGNLEILAGPKQFTVRELYNGAISGSDGKERVAYGKKVSSLRKEITAAALKLSKTIKKINALRLAAEKMDINDKSLIHRIHQIRNMLLELDEKMNGNRSKSQVGEKNDPTIMYRLYNATSGISRNTYGPTKTQVMSYEITVKRFTDFKKSLDQITEIEIPRIENKLSEAGAPTVY